MKKCKYKGCTNEARHGKTKKGEPTQHGECNPCCNNMRKYGITTPQRDKLLADQDGKCAICSKPIEFKTGGASVDHQDMPFRIRGILCISCNTGLGKLGDNEEGLLRALAYIKG